MSLTLEVQTAQVLTQFNFESTSGLPWSKWFEYDKVGVTMVNDIGKRDNPNFERFCSNSN